MPHKIFTKKTMITAIVVMISFLFLPLHAQKQETSQEIDEEYSRLIREATTKPEFLSPLVRSLPKVEGVPTPKEVLGYIVGAPGKLTYYEDILKYMNLLDQASPRVKVFPIGKTSEGRKMVVVAVSSEDTLKNFSTYQKYMAKLADPRVVETEEQAQNLIKKAKPVYWLTCNLHSSESGSAEVSMELAYRLAVDESPFIKKIRENTIILITPSMEPDGHDKHTDWFYKYNKDVTDYEKISGVPYWGKYIYHDNNRDMIAVSQPEMQNALKAFFEWHPVVVQDNHESIPFLYVSSGTGPYNPHYQPSMTSEWNLIAWWEVTRMTSYGMPGVWTHSFWTGWAPNYLGAVASNHNGIIRFYETFGNSIGNTMERDLEDGESRLTSKEWYRPVPPYEKVLWSMRNNVNYQMTAELQAFSFVASHKEYFLRNFWKRGRSAYEQGKKEAPYAYIVPSEQKDPVDTAELVNILLKQRVEVHKAPQKIKLQEKEFPKGSFVIRLDQPYGPLAQNLLEIQQYPDDAPRAYDDTGWTLGLHMDVQTAKIEDKSVLETPVVRVREPVKPEGKVYGGNAGAYIINHRAVNTLLPARLKLGKYKALAAQRPFQVKNKKFNQGSLIIPASNSPHGLKQALQSVASKMGLDVHAVKRVPDVSTHEMDIPRTAIFHTWSSTQDDGWVRFAFDDLGIPFEMIHKGHLREGNLRDKYDVILFSNCRGGRGADIVNGLDPGFRGPLAFVRSEEFKHLGTPDSCEDITGGMGIQGVAHLQDFVRQGGLVIFLHNAVRVPLDYGLVRGIRVFETSSRFYNPGSLLQAEVVNEAHPLVYGYEKKMPVYRNHGGPLLRISDEKKKYVALKYAEEGDLCLSGIVKSKKEIKGKAAIVDVPLGKGHIILFTFNPFWRDLSHASYMFVFNALLHHNDLDVGLEEKKKGER